jgi:hypothetical protein
MPESVPLSAPASEPANRRVSPWGGRVDILLFALVIAFAFLAASFVARNSDVWLHLATGRAIANGEYRFGAEPFAYTTTGQYWANHAWLFDWKLYLLFTWFGGAGAVLWKAAIVAITGVAMLRAAHGTGAKWITGACILLALLAMTPRLLLQPAIASLCLLAVCLCCLRAGGRAYRAVPVLIAVWVNVDAWFVLGPVLVACFWLGRKLSATTETPWPAWLGPAALLACLVSPHHIHALRLPMELSPAVWTSELRNHPQFENVFASPWNAEPLTAAGGYSLAVFAFFALLVLTVLSFALNRKSLFSWRGTVLVPFALLAAWQARLVPFFAVVAGPILALNLREVISETRFVRIGRAAVLAACVTLLALSWLGWTTGFNNRERGTAWRIHTDPTLARAATGIAEARKSNLLPAESRVFASHADVGHYLAWFAPGERYFLDSRLQLFTSAASDYTALQSLAPQNAESVRKHNIGAVLLYESQWNRLNDPAWREVWTPSRIDGSAMLLLPKQNREAMPFERLAFGAQPNAPQAKSGPAKFGEAAPWWRVSQTGRIGSAEADSATVYLRLTDSGSESPALPLLAIRNARIGIESDAHDSLAWLALGRGYAVLGEKTWERKAGAGVTVLEHLRLVQITTAFAQSVSLNPASIPAREALAGIYLQRNMLDLALPHATEALKLLRRTAHTSGEQPHAERIQRLTQVVESLQLALVNAENRYLVRTAALTGDPLARAQLAAELGLMQRAIDVLMKSHVDLYGVVGLGMLADLLLQTGQAAECRVLLDREELRRNPYVLGSYSLPRKPDATGYSWQYQLPTYDWIEFCLNAAIGRYADATEVVERMCARLEAEERLKAPMMTVNGGAILTLEVGLAVPVAPVVSRVSRVRERAALAELVVGTKALSTIRGDLFTLAGILELERGNTAEATIRFAQANALFTTTRNFGVMGAGEMLAERYGEAIRINR